MSNVAKIAVPLLLLAAAGGAFYLYNQSTGPIDVPSGAPPAQPAQPTTQTPVDPVKPATAPAAAAQDPIRTEAPTASTAGSSLPQGVRGRVLLPTGAPAADVTVMLLESSVGDPLQIFLKNRTGQVSPPLSTAATAADGTFALGLRKPDQAVDLRVVTDAYPEFSQQPIKLRSEEWYDAGDIRLEQGLVVTGRVLDAATKGGIGGATVYLASSHQSHARVATPGRERGTVAQSDPTGFFQFTNAPRLGLVNMVVEAPGYATASLLNQQLKPDAPSDFAVELEPGQPITGVVVDQRGRPVPGAKVVANALSTKAPQTDSVAADEDGRFAFPSLRTGPYQLIATASQFAEVRIPMAMTGEDVKIVMATRGSIKLQVLTANQRPVKAYRISLKRSFPNNPMGIGNVIDFPDRNVSPADYPPEFGGDWAVVSGLPAGTFRVQILEQNHAKTLSPEFTIAEGGSDPVEVTAVLTLGASITGTVIDDRGAPVAGATVTSDMNAGFAADTGIFEMFRSMLPEKHTSRQTRTDGQGRFRLNQLSFADYMVRVSHPDYCEAVSINLTLSQEGQVVDAGVVQLSRGAIVEGMTLLEGRAVGQVKVVVSLPMTAENLPPAALPGAAPGAAPTATAKPGQPERTMFSANTLSDGEGRYRLLKRVPPGTYKITASRQSADNPFGALLDMKQTEQQLVIAPGQERAEVNFTLPSR